MIFNWFQNTRIYSGSRLRPLLKTMSLDEFSMTTSLHGWHFIVNARDWKQKMGWLILIGLSIGIVKTLNYKFKQNYLHSTCPQLKYEYDILCQLLLSTLLVSYLKTSSAARLTSLLTLPVPAWRMSSSPVLQSAILTRWGRLSWVFWL